MCTKVKSGQCFVMSSAGRVEFYQASLRLLREVSGCILSITMIIATSQGPKHLCVGRHCSLTDALT